MSTNNIIYVENIDAMETQGEEIEDLPHCSRSLTRLIRIGSDLLMKIYLFCISHHFSLGICIFLICPVPSSTDNLNNQLAKELWPHQSKNLVIIIFCPKRG